jgi:transposase
MLVNALRGHSAEFGIVASRGIQKVEELTAAVADESDERIPTSARNALRTLAAELAALDVRIARVETEIVARARTDAVARRLATIPGIGPIIASRLSAMVPDPSIFRSGRDFAAWIGLVPRQSSTGGKTRLGGISKRGNAGLRRLLVGSAMAAMFRSRALPNDPWLCQLRGRKPVMVTAVALANKIARAVWVSCDTTPSGSRPRRDLLPDPTSLAPCSPPSRPCRLRRWPSASLDRGCARRPCGPRSGRRNGSSIEQRN